MPYRVTLLAVFVLTVVVDLTLAVEFGLVAACLTFIYRISSLSRSEGVPAQQHPVLQGDGLQVQAHRLYGALFFGAVKFQMVCLGLKRSSQLQQLQQKMFEFLALIEALK